MTTTRREIILAKYEELIKAVKEVIPDQAVFPEADLMDVADIMFYVNMAFFGCSDNKAVLQNVLTINSIEVNEDEFNRLLIAITPFLDYLSQLK